jgi:hypothetical protein
MQAAPPCGEAAYGTVVERGRIVVIASCIFNNDSFIEIGTKTKKILLSKLFYRRYLYKCSSNEFKFQE